jgi:hypothetical protein
MKHQNLIHKTLLTLLILLVTASSPVLAQTRSEGVQISNVSYAFWANTPGRMAGQAASMILQPLPDGLPVGTGPISMIALVSTTGSTQFRTEKRMIEITATVNNIPVVSLTNDTMIHGFLAPETSNTALYILEFSDGMIFDDLANGVTLTLETTLTVENQPPETNSQTFQLGGWGGN